MNKTWMVLHCKKKKIDAHVSGKWILRTYYFSQKCKTEENVYHNIIDTNLDT